MSSTTAITTNLAPLQTLMEQARGPYEDIGYHRSEQRFVIINGPTVDDNIIWGRGNEIIAKVHTLMKSIIELDFASLIRLNHNLETILQGACYEISPKFDPNTEGLLTLLQYLNNEYNLLVAPANKKLITSFINHFDANLLSTEDLKKFFIKLISHAYTKHGIGPTAHVKFKPLIHYLADHPDDFECIGTMSSLFYANCALKDLTADDLYSLDRITSTFNNSLKAKPSTEEQKINHKWLKQQMEGLKVYFFSPYRENISIIQDLIEKKIEITKSLLIKILPRELVDIIISHETFDFLTEVIRNRVKSYTKKRSKESNEVLHTFSSRSCQVTVDPVMRELFSTFSPDGTEFYRACYKVGNKTWEHQPDFVQKATRLMIPTLASHREFIQYSKSLPSLSE